MGTCITVIKIVGASSLGLMTGSLTYQSFQTIPDLIRQLNNQVSISANSASEILSAVTTNLLVSKALNVLLASLLTAFFAMAYKYSPASAKHPYLLYSALGGPLALVLLFYKGSQAEARIVKLSRTRKSQTLPNAEPTVSAAKEDDDEAALGKSYIHVSDDSLSNTSTPGSSAPGSPTPGSLQQAVAVEPTTSAIEQEVEDALSKKEYVNDLESLKAAYTVASTVASVGLAICTIGFVGDFYFI